MPYVSYFVVVGRKTRDDICVMISTAFEIAVPLAKQINMASRTLVSVVNEGCRASYGYGLRGLRVGA